MDDGRFPVEIAGGVPVVEAPDEIDIINAPDLRSALLQAAADGHGTLVADMTRTRFCDSAGLHTLLAAHKRAQAEGGQLLLVISGTAVAVLRVFALTGIDRMIPNFTSLDQALAHTSPGRSNGRPRPGDGLTGNGATVMSGPDAADHAEYLRQKTRLRNEAARLASSAAPTGEKTADTSENSAGHRPAADTERLRAHAESARHHAAEERGLSNRLNKDRGGRRRTPGGERGLGAAVQDGDVKA